MARLALAVSVLLSLALLSPAHYLHSDLPNDEETLPVVNSLPDTAAIRLPSDTSSSGHHEPTSIPKPQTAFDGPIPTIEAVPIESIPIEASLIPVRRNFPYDRPFWRRPGRHCRHLHHGRPGGNPRGAIVSYGNDMIVSGKRMGGFVSEDRMRRIYVDGGAHRHGGGVLREEISVEELMKQREMGLPQEIRGFPRWHHEAHRREGHRSLVKRFLDFLNRH